MVNQLETAFICALSIFGTFGKNPYSPLNCVGLHTQAREHKDGAKLPCALCRVLPAGGTAQNSLPTLPFPSHWLREQEIAYYKVLCFGQIAVSVCG